MSGQNRVIVLMLGVLAALVIVVGGLSAVLLLGGGEEGTTTSAPDESGGIDSGTDTGGTGGSDTSDSVDASGRLRLAGSDPVTMDPHLAGDSGSAEFIVEIFSGLVTISPELNIELDLAESFEVSDDGLVYTFTLRDDAFFHQGRRVTADDVRWSMERAASRELASPTALAYLGDILGVRERFYEGAESITGIEVIDDRTIQFTIDEPKPYFLAKLS